MFLAHAHTSCSESRSATGRDSLDWVTGAFPLKNQQRRGIEVSSPQTIMAGATRPMDLVHIDTTEPFPASHVCSALMAPICWYIARKHERRETTPIRLHSFVLDVEDFITHFFFVGPISESLRGNV